MSLPSSMADFVPCDRLLQKAYSTMLHRRGPIVNYVPRGGFGGGYNFKTSLFLGDKIFTGKKHEGGQIL